MDQQPLHEKVDCLSFHFIYFWIFMLVVFIFSMLCKILVLWFIDFLIILPLGLVFEILIKNGISTLTNTLLTHIVVCKIFLISSHDFGFKKLNTIHKKRRSYSLYKTPTLARSRSGHDK